MKILSRLIPLTNIYWVPTAEMNLMRSLPFSVSAQLSVLFYFIILFLVFTNKILPSTSLASTSQIWMLNHFFRFQKIDFNS